MTIEIFLILAVVLVAVILFSIERIPADVVALGVLMFLAVTGLIPSDKIFSGFGSDSVMMILGLLIMTAALSRTGVVELIGKQFVRGTGDNPQRLLAGVMLVASGLSSIISNTAAAAFFIPLVIGVAHRTRQSTSKLLMPLAFAAILSSSVTLVATSTNIVVSGLMVQQGLEPLGMFELTPVGIPIVVLGLLYMQTIGQKLLPRHKEIEQQAQYEEMGVPPYLTEVVIMRGSPMIHKSLQEAGLGQDLDLTILSVVRGNDLILAPQAELRLAEGDVLLVEGQRNDILKVEQVGGLGLRGTIKLSEANLQSKDVGLVEAIILLGSPLIGRTLRGVQFRERFGLQVIAINRHGETIATKLSQVRMQLGDVLLVQGPRSNFFALETDRTFRILGEVEAMKPNRQRATIAILAFVGALLIGSLEILPLTVAIFLGVLVVFLTRCITPSEAYRQVEWKALILIGSMLGLGIALESTGAAAYLADLIVNLFGNANPLWLLGGFFILTMVLTQPMSNQAAAAVVVPIAMQTAIQMGVNPRTFAVMIAVGASCSYLTPLEPACLMVYGPGRYRFIDFVKVGSLLTLAIFILAMIFVPLLWPLE
jgi:di/tricarboxylate transporter